MCSSAYFHNFRCPLPDFEHVCLLNIVLCIIKETNAGWKMATSLARQLKQLAVPHTQAILGEDKKKVSLLFDPKDAATFDKETFYALGVNGLEELEGIDPSFQEFHESLFSEKSLTFERSVQTKEVNAKLNTVISRFLYRLSPYFLLKAAQKALEWLVQRYHIHFYNVDELMVCVLPYHDSKIFVRVVQLLDLSHKSVIQWSWLQPIQKPGVHLARSSLIGHCGKHTGFLSFICDAVPKFVKAHDDAEDFHSPQFLKTLFSFYTMTVISVLDAFNITEMLISTLIEPIGRGLQSRIPAYQASSYMILAQLFRKAKVKKDLAENFVHLICKFINPQLVSEAITCLLVIYQTQDLTKLHKKNFKQLSRKMTLGPILRKLSLTFNVQPLMDPLLANLVPAAFKQSALNILSSDSSDDESFPRPQLMLLLQDFLTNVTLHESTAINVAKNVLRNFISKLIQDQEHRESHHTMVRGIVRQLEAKYPNALDIAVDDVMLSADSPEEKKAISSFLNLSAMTTQHQILPDSNTSLVLCLNHRQASVRKSAVSYMLEHINDLDDSSFISDSLLTRLEDDNPEIVKMILQHPQLPELVEDKTELQDKFLKLLQTYNSVSSVMTKHILKWVCEETSIPDEVSVVVVLSHLFLLSGSVAQVDLTKQVFQSSLAQRNHILTSLKADWLPVFMKAVGANGSIDHIMGLNHKLARYLGKAIVLKFGADSVKQFRALYEQSGSSPRLSAFLCVVMLSVCESLSVTEDDILTTRLCLQLLHMIQDVVFHKKLMSNKTTTSSSGKVLLKDALQSCVVNFKKDSKMTPEMISHMLEKLIQSLSVPEELLKTDLWYYHGDGGKTDDWLETVVLLFDFLLDLVDDRTMKGQGKHLVSVFMTNLFPDTLVLLKFFCLMWTQHANTNSSELGLSGALQARALYLGYIKLQAIDDKMAAHILDRPSPVLTSLLVVFSSSHERLHELALHCLGTLYKQSGSRPALFKPLVETILRNQEEIRSDPDFIAQVFVTVLEQTQVRDKKASPKQRRRRSCSHSFMSGALGNLLEILVKETTPIWIVRPILGILRQINSVESMTQLLPLLDRLLQLPNDKFGSVEFDCVELLLERYTTDTAACIQKDSLPLQVLTKAIESTHNPVHSRPSVAEIAINQISREVYAGLPSDSVKQTVLSSLFTSWLNTLNISVSNSVRKIVKKTLHLKADYIISELKPVLQMTSAVTVREAKRQKKRPSEESSPQAVFDRPEWQIVVIVLDAVQDKKKLDNRSALIPVCFQVLSKALELEDHNNAEYIKQLLLTTIYNLCNRLNTEEEEGGSIPEEHFSMELIVQCIRTSDNPQTHHQALLVLTVSAKICPEHLLHNIMTVFTFMGANILRQDDSYSFHVISKILENVIPALISTCEEKSPRTSSLTSKPEDVITMVMRVFVDAYPHIPQHRKLMLFTKLVRIVGQKEYLWRCLLLFVEHIVTRERSVMRSDASHLVLEEKVSGPIPPAEMEFILSLSTSFSPVTQLKAARDAILYISQLPDDKDDSVIRRKSLPQSLGTLKQEESDIFSIYFHTAKQLRHFKYAGLHLLVSLFSHQQFVSQISAKEGKKSLHKNFEALLETLLQFIGKISKTVDKHTNTPTSKFWKAYLHKAYELMDKIASLLPDVVFVEVVSGLLKHSLPAVQRKAMELLNTRLQQVKDITDQDQEETLLSLVEELSAIVKQTTLDSKDVEEMAVNGQTALYSLKVLCRLLGSKHPDEFVKVLQLTSKVLVKRKDNLNVLACALLCVGEVCADLKVHVIPNLSTFMPKVIKIMGRTEELLGNELLLLSCVTAVNKVVENLPHFLSPYILDITKHYCVLSGGEAAQKQPVQQRLQAIKHAMATVLPTRVMLPTIVSCYQFLVEDHQDCIECLMLLLEAHIREMKKEDLASFHNEILNFFFTCLDFRTDHSKESLSEKDKVEDSVINTVISMVMKMSEATFRPMLYKVFDWATRQEDKKLRVLIFYRLADRLAGKLKSLFTLFAGYIVKHAAEVLDENNSSKDEDGKYFGKGKRSRKMSCQLMEYVLDCLHKCFLHDSGDFVTVERFDTLMQPIVDQIENTLGGDETYKHRISQHLVPCIGQLAVAARDDSLWKSMNYQILLKTRSSSPQVKFASLDVIEEFHRRLGEDFMPLLPETVPFLAELMEDENEEVEKRCQSVIADMETTLGEPLQKYF